MPKMTKNGQKRPKLAKIDPKWLKMTKNGPNWPQMTLNNLKWPKNAQTWGRGSEPIGALVFLLNYYKTANNGWILE